MFIMKVALRHNSRGSRHAGGDLLHRSLLTNSMTSLPPMVTHTLLMSLSGSSFRRRSPVWSLPTVSHTSTTSTCTSCHFIGNIDVLKHPPWASPLLLGLATGEEAREPPDPPDPPDPSSEETLETQPPLAHQISPPSAIIIPTLYTTHKPPPLLSSTSELNQSPLTLVLLQETVSSITDNRTSQPPASRTRARNGNRRGIGQDAATVDVTPVSSYGIHKIHHLGMGQDSLLLGQGKLQMGRVKSMGCAHNKAKKPNKEQSHCCTAISLGIFIDSCFKSSGTEALSESFFKAPSEAQPSLVKEHSEVFSRNFPMASSLNYRLCSIIVIVYFVMYLNIIGSISVSVVTSG